VRGDSVVDNRLVGLRPVLDVSGAAFVLTASGRERASVACASFELDPALIGVFREGDCVSLVRTETTGLGVSLLRDGELVFAIGAATAVPVGGSVTLRGGRDPEWNALDVTTKSGWESWLHPRDNWIDVSASGVAARLRAGADETVGGLRVSVLRCFEYELFPGRDECLAVSRSADCPHDVAFRSANLLARDTGGLTVNKWPS